MIYENCMYPPDDLPRPSWPGIGPGPGDDNDDDDDDYHLRVVAARSLVDRLIGSLLVNTVRRSLIKFPY